MSYARSGTLGQLTDLVSTGSSAVTTLINGVFNVSGSGYPKPAPAPLPFTVTQVTTMLQKSPVIYASLVKHIAGASPVDTQRVCGLSPSAAAAQAKGSVAFAAQVGLALANAQGAPHGNISIGEANIRATIQQGMLNFQQTSGQGETVTVPGTGVQVTLPKTASTAGVGILLGIGVVGAAIVMGRSHGRR